MNKKLWKFICVFSYMVSRINIKINFIRYIILLLLLFDCNVQYRTSFFFVNKTLTRSNYTIVKLPACSENSFYKNTTNINEEETNLYTQNISNSIRTPPLCNIHQCFALFKIQIVVPYYILLGY